ncbi:MAG: shikimate dehydrogenase [Pseudomonadota bacterium]|jgi:shikimate dehydrogenase
MVDNPGMSSCTPSIDRYAVVGHPIAHSKSPTIHRLFAQATGQRMDYSAIEAAPNAFAETLARFVAQGGKGMNVTLPFKVEACALATDPMPSAVLAGAANCLAIRGERIEAHNFDGTGLVTDIAQHHGTALDGRRVLVLGAGGATRGALPALAAAGPAVLAVANRTAQKALDLQTHFAPHFAVQAGGFEDLAGESFDVVINATSTGLSDQTLALPLGLFAPNALAYDMVYGQGLTPFMRQAQAAGVCRLADGLGMLVEQAAEAFALWRGVRPKTVDVIRSLRGVSICAFSPPRP